MYRDLCCLMEFVNLRATDSIAHICPRWHLAYLCTGWSILFLYTLTGLYDKNTMNTKKIVVCIHSVYPDISTKIVNFDIYKHLHCKNLNLKIDAIFTSKSN